MSSTTEEFKLLTESRHLFKGVVLDDAIQDISCKARQSMLTYPLSSSPKLQTKSGPVQHQSG
jgi:hypothetical protein